jgi:hypothetical protein
VELVSNLNVESLVNSARCPTRYNPWYTTRYNPWYTTRYNPWYTTWYNPWYATWHNTCIVKKELYPFLSLCSAVNALSCSLLFLTTVFLFEYLD